MGSASAQCSDMVAVPDRPLSKHAAVSWQPEEKLHLIEHGLRMKALGRQGLLLLSFLVSGLAGLALHQVAFQISSS